MRRKYLIQMLPLCLLSLLSSCGQTLNDEFEYEAIISEIDISESMLSFTGVGQTQIVKIKCNSYWVAETNTDWLYLNIYSGKGNGTLSIGAYSNPSATSERSGKVTVSDGIKILTINVTQAPAQASFSLSENSLQFDYDGGSSTVYVETNVRWSATSDADWCSLTTTSSSISIRVQSNYSYSPRMAYITVKGLSSSGTSVIMISQSAPKEPVFGNVTVSDITMTSAIFKIPYTSDDLYIQTCGVCYSTTKWDPTTNDKCQYVSRNSKSDTVTISLSGLKQATHYYLRPYVETSAGITYGSCIQIITDRVNVPNEGDNPTPIY